MINLKRYLPERDIKRLTKADMKEFEDKSLDFYTQGDFTVAILRKQHGSKLLQFGVAKRNYLDKSNPNLGQQLAGMRAIRDYVGGFQARA